MVQVEDPPAKVAAGSGGASSPGLTRLRIGSSAVLWLSSLLCSLGCMLLFALIQRAELLLNGGRPPGGFLVAHASEMAMRVTALSHYVVAVFFFATSARGATRAGRGWLVGLLGAGGAILAVFSAIGGTRNPLGMVLLVLAFFAHAFHDDIFFYRQYARERGREVRDPHHVLAWLQVAGLGVLGTILLPLSIIVAYHGVRDGLPAWVPFKVRVHPSHREVLQSFLPGEWTPLGLLALFGLPCAIVLAVSVARLVALRVAVREHAPMVRVLAASVALTLSIAVLGVTILNLIILMHVVAWFLFTSGRLRAAEARSSAPRAPGIVGWLRGTRRGFWAFHLGSAVAVMALITFDHYVLGDTVAWGGYVFPNPLAAVLNPKIFYYWTILHIVVSLVPRGRAPERARPLGAAAPA